MPARKKQAACPHPARHVHPTIDARFDTCDLCHVIARAPLLPPWIIAHDEAQPAPRIRLFADYDYDDGDDTEGDN